MYFEHAPIRCSDHIIVLQPDQSRFLVLKSIIFYWIIWIDMWLCLNNCHQVLIFRRGSISHISHHPLSCFQLIILSEPVIFTHPPYILMFNMFNINLIPNCSPNLTVGINLKSWTYTSWDCFHTTFNFSCQMNFKKILF